CGTGEISIRLAEKGFEVTGIDLSEEMLSYAQQKASSNQPILFLQQDMREITGFDGQFDAVAICCDSLNYLKTKNDVIETVKPVDSNPKVPQTRVVERYVELRDFWGRRWQVEQRELGVRRVG
ncbi:class I SAM-dependent methyltransferase, partial [Bacillus cereus]|nr:class I SAM-dependent methyltransferase [Bacillus cereus]